MNYIEKIMGDTCTLVVLIFLFVIFVYYIWKVIKICKITISQIGNVANRPNLLEYLENSCLVTRFISKEYKRTICFRDRDESLKTSEFASDYFNLSAILTAAKINVNAMGAAAGILVGIGVLGTFIGLTIGLGDIDLTQVKDNPDQLIKGVGGLIAGMKTAFVTSVAGMLLSTIYTLAEKYSLNILTKKCVTISDKLDEVYYISELEKQTIVQERQKKDMSYLVKNLVSEMNKSMDSQIKFVAAEMTKNFTAIDGNGNTVTSGNMLNAMMKSCAEQKSMIEGVLEEFYDRLSDGLRESTLEPLMQKLDELTKAVQSPAASMASSIGDDLRRSIMEMIDELKNSVSSATTERLEILGRQLDNASDTMSTLPEILQKLTESIQNNVGQMSEQISAANAQTAQVGANLVEKQSQMNDKSVALMQEFEKQANASAATLKETAALLTKFERLHKTVESAASKLESASGHVENSATSLQQSQDNLVQTYKKSIEETDHTFKQIEESLDHSKDVSAQYAQEFSEISESLEGIFKELSDGLNQYSETVAKRTKEFLDAYTQNVTKVSESLSNTYGELSDTLEKLPNVLNGARR